MRIPIPEGFQFPDGKGDGDEIEVLAMVRPAEGQLEILSINGSKVAPEAEEEKMEDEMATKDKKPPAKNSEGKNTAERFKARFRPEKKAVAWSGPEGAAESEY